MTLYHCSRLPVIRKIGYYPEVTDDLRAGQMRTSRTSPVPRELYCPDSNLQRWFATAGIQGVHIKPYGEESSRSMDDLKDPKYPRSSGDSVCLGEKKMGENIRLSALPNGGVELTIYCSRARMDLASSWDGQKKIVEGNGAC
jgi:hypothetical protein